jgi:hypothetical protein
MWAAVLLYSATRSSYVAVCKSDDVDKQPSRLDASEAEGPLAVAAPWRIACVAERPSKEGAEAVAAAVSKCGGFRARFRACDALRLAAPSRDNAPAAAEVAAALSSIDLGLHGECGAAARRGRRIDARGDCPGCSRGSLTWETSRKHLIKGLLIKVARPRLPQASARYRRRQLGTIDEAYTYTGAAGPRRTDSTRPAAARRRLPNTCARRRGPVRESTSESGSLDDRR